MIKELDELSTEERGMLFPIYLLPHNPKWAFLFQEEKRKILELLGKSSVNRIEHIGSTAVPHLKSKPTIDILIEIKENTDIELLKNSFKNLGYHFISKPENPPPHIMLVKGYTIKGFVGQSYHIHIRYKGDWDEIYFRDYLMKNPSVAEEYANLKEKLALRYKHDREAYTESKTEFIKHVTRIARKKLG